MPHFAQLDGTLVTATLEAPQAPTILPPGRTFVEIDPSTVQCLDTYDPETGTFTAGQMSAPAVTIRRG